MPKLKPVALLAQYACYVIGYEWRAARRMPDTLAPLPAAGTVLRSA